MSALRSAFTTILKGEGSKNLLKKGGSMMFWQAATLVLTFASTIWIARCLGPYELGRSGFIMVTASQILLLISVCPNTYATRITKNSDHIELTTGLIVTSRMLASAFYLLVVSFLFIMGIIPSDWHILALLGILIPILMAFQPHWLFQALENQSAQFKSSAIVACAIALYAGFFIRKGSSGTDELIARLIALTIGLFVAWWLTGCGTPTSYFKLKQILPSLNEIWRSRTLFGTQIVMYVTAGIELPLVAYLMNVEQLGMYRTATQLALGMNTFLAMLPLLYYPKFLEWEKVSASLLWEKQKKLFLIIFTFVVPACVLVLLLGPLFFRALFGEHFSAAGMPFSVLLISKLVVMLGSVFAWGLWAKSKDFEILIIFSFVALIIIASNLILIPLYGIIAAASVNLFGNGCVLVLTYLLAKKENNKNSVSLDGVET